MSDKRTVSTDALETLGTIIGDGEKRDAIHLAVEPAIAAHKLLPGQDVGFISGGVGMCGKPVGIVDPFLKVPVQQGQRFWLVVYPRQITSLRHVWTHPEFPPENLAGSTFLGASVPISPDIDKESVRQEIRRELEVEFESRLEDVRECASFGCPG